MVGIISADECAERQGIAGSSTLERMAQNGVTPFERAGDHARSE